jgi:hypothetical protein
MRQTIIVAAKTALVTAIIAIWEPPSSSPRRMVPKPRCRATRRNLCRRFGTQTAVPTKRPTRSTERQVAAFPRQAHEIAPTTVVGAFLFLRS